VLLRWSCICTVVTCLCCRKQATAVKPGSKRRSPAGRAGASAAKWHSATSSKARSRPAARAGSTAAGPGPAAVQAAAVAVDAATAAVAAAWADARGRCRSRTAAAEVASPHASAVLGTGANLQESFSLESWQGVQAQPSACCTWLSSHDTVLSDAAGAAVNAAACAAACQAQEDACSAGAAALHQASYPDIVHSSSCWHSSPVAPRPRAASAGSMRSSCCDAADGIQQQQQHVVAMQAAAQLRSRSTSPGTGLRRSSSCHLHSAAHRPGSSGSGMIHEYPCAAGCAGAACTCACDAIARVYPARQHSPAPRTSSPVAGDALSHAVLEAGQRDRLWKCLELHSPAGAKLALQQQQQGAGRSAAAVEARLQAELSAGQLSDLRLQRYSTFVSFMSVQHNWRARALAARTSRCAYCCVWGTWFGTTTAAAWHQMPGSTQLCSHMLAPCFKKPSGKAFCYTC
jgi:hypothetical protein